MAPLVEAALADSKVALPAVVAFVIEGGACASADIAEHGAVVYPSHILEAAEGAFHADESFLVRCRGAAIFRPLGSREETKQLPGRGPISRVLGAALADDSGEIGWDMMRSRWQSDGVGVRLVAVPTARPIALCDLAKCTAQFVLVVAI